MIQLVLAIGIRPAKTTILSEETPVFAGKFWVVNNDLQDITVIVSANGELENYITINNPEITFSKADEFKPVYFEVSLPDELPPGESGTHIVVEQKLSSTEQGFIASKLVLRHKILVQGPYPDKFIKTKINFRQDGDLITLISEVENFGKEDISKLQTNFYVNDKNQQEHEVGTKSTSLKRKENKLLTATLAKDSFGEGEFEVKAVTTYDDQQTELVKKMQIGKPEIDITYFNKYFVSGEINKYSLDLLNKWNKQIENVFVEVEVNKDNQKVDSFTTPSTEIPGLSVKKVSDYFDARKKNAGKYSFDMVVNYWNSYKMDTKTFNSELLEKERFNEISDTTASSTLSGASTFDNSSNSSDDFYFWVVTFIIFAIIVSFFIYRRSHHSHYKDQEW